MASEAAHKRLKMMTIEQCPIASACVLLPCLRVSKSHEGQPCPHPDAIERIRAAEKVLEQHSAVHAMVGSDYTDIERERFTTIAEAIFSAVAVLALTGLWLI